MVEFTPQVRKLAARLHNRIMQNDCCPKFRRTFSFVSPLSAATSCCAGGTTTHGIQERPGKHAYGISSKSCYSDNENPAAASIPPGQYFRQSRGATQPQTIHPSSLVSGQWPHRAHKYHHPKHAKGGVTIGPVFSNFCLSVLRCIAHPRLHTDNWAFSAESRSDIRHCSLS